MEEEKVQEQTQTPVEESKGMSTASMVLGIVSIALFCIWYISIPCAIVAIVLGILGKKKGGKGMATTGLVLGIIAVGLVLLFAILAAAGLATLTSAITSSL